MQPKKVNPILATLGRAFAASEFAVCALVLVAGSAALAPHRTRAAVGSKPIVMQPSPERNADIAAAAVPNESMPRSAQGDQP